MIEAEGTHEDARLELMTICGVVSLVHVSALAELVSSISYPPSP
jgi:hypothetical protein